MRKSYSSVERTHIKTEAFGADCFLSQTLERERERSLFLLRWRPFFPEQWRRSFRSFDRSSRGPTKSPGRDQLDGWLRGLWWSGGRWTAADARARDADAWSEVLGPLGLRTVPIVARCLMTSS